MDHEPNCRADTSNLSGIVVHSGRIFCVRGYRIFHSILDYPDLSPIGSSHAHLLFRQSRRSSSASIAPLKYPRSSSHTKPIWYYHQFANPVSGHTRIYLHLRRQRTPPRLNASHPHSLKIAAKDSSPAKASAATNVNDLDDVKLYCFCENYNFGYTIGTRPESN